MVKYCRDHKKILFALTVVFLIIGMSLIGIFVGYILELGNCIGLILGFGIGFSISAFICFRTLRYIMIFNKNDE